MEKSVEVVKVEIEESWPCERCGTRIVVAYIAIRDLDMTYGYCVKCLPHAINSELGIEP